MIIYGEKCKSEIKRKKAKCYAVIAAASVFEAIVIALSLCLFTKENYLFYQILLSVITFLYAGFCLLVYRLRLKSVINLDKLLKKFEIRKTERVSGAFISEVGKSVSDSGVSFRALNFDTGMKYRDEVVYRELLLERSFDVPFERGKFYELEVIDNVILEYGNE